MRRILRLLRTESGQELVEFALALPLLLILFLGLVEAGNSLSIKHKIAVLTREGANIASRGSSLEETLTAVMESGVDIRLSETGGAIISRVVVDDGEPVIDAQLAHPGFETRSRIGLPDSTAVVLSGLPFEDGQVLYVVEILVDYDPLTPLAALVPAGVADEVYERAIF